MKGDPQVLADSRGRMGAYAAPMLENASALLAQAARRLGLGPAHELSLLLTDNPTIERLNRRWRAKPRPTDVLSFPLHELKPGHLPPPGPVGDIVVSLPYARAAARREGVTFERHVARLLIHGLLHLLGHDHEKSEREARRMEREEERLMGECGV